MDDLDPSSPTSFVHRLPLLLRHAVLRRDGGASAGLISRATRRTRGAYDDQRDVEVWPDLEEPGRGPPVFVFVSPGLVPRALEVPHPPATPCHAHAPGARRPGGSTSARYSAPRVTATPASVLTSHLPRRPYWYWVGSLILSSADFIERASSCDSAWAAWKNFCNRSRPEAH